WAQVRPSVAVTPDFAWSVGSKDGAAGKDIAYVWALYRPLVSDLNLHSLPVHFYRFLDYLIESQDISRRRVKASLRQRCHCCPGLGVIFKEPE
ncbi:MAG: hypothetical protein PVJ34_13170, partial [Anaerolineae bacterium]